MDQIEKKLKPGVSILMLTYNRANYISAAISSVIKQTYPTWELHIIDDGSSDYTEKIVSAFTDQRIKYHKHEENLGLVIRRKESVSYADHEYLAILDSDDFWTDTTKLETQVSYLKENPTSALIGSNIIDIDSNNQIIGQSQYHTTDQKIRENLLRKNQFAHSSCLMRTQMVKACGGYQEYTFAEDLELFLRLGQIGQFANLSQITTAHRLHHQAISNNLVRHIPTLIKIIKKYKGSYPGYFWASVKYHLYYSYLLTKKTFGF